MSDKPITPFATAEEMAEHYGVARSTFLAWFHEGKISAEVAVGKVYRFDRERVAAELRANAEKVRGTQSPGDRVPLI